MSRSKTQRIAGGKEMKPIEKMADYIYYTSPCICEICADCERCNAKLKKAWRGHEHDLDFVPPQPSKEQCINGILKFFEKDSK